MTDRLVTDGAESAGVLDLARWNTRKLELLEDGGAVAAAATHLKPECCDSAESV